MSFTRSVLDSLPAQTLVGYLAVFVVPVTLPPLFLKLVSLGGLRDVLSYEPGHSLVHRLDPRVKLLYSLVLGIATVVLSWQLVFLLLALTLAGWAAVFPPRRRLRVLLALGITPAVTLIWSQALFHPLVAANGTAIVDVRFPWTISWFGTDGISLTGLLYGAEQAGRTLVTISVSLLLIVTTSPSDIVWAFRKFRLPVSAGFALTAALRFLPDLFGRLSTLLQAVQVRGLDLTRPAWGRWRDWPGYLHRLAVAVPIVTVPLLIGALRGTRTMAMVADARAFGGPMRPTIGESRRITATDWVAGGWLGALVVAIVVLLTLHVGGRAGLP
ncbi:MAG: energy-coupling factor transporter transmembrane component T [Candidatus Dormiibacterota bacterium]